MKVKLIYTTTTTIEKEVEIDDKFAPLADDDVDCEDGFDLCWELFDIGYRMVKEEGGDTFTAFETLDGGLMIEE